VVNNNKRPREALNDTDMSPDNSHLDGQGDDDDDFDEDEDGDGMWLPNNTPHFFPASEVFALWYDVDDLHHMIVCTNLFSP